jgi:hypothetical protein
MRYWAAITPALLLVGFVALPYSHQASGQTQAGWITLFDGKNLDNWNQIGNANWRIEDGVVVADKGNGFLVSKASYTDFLLKAEFWVDDDANSGIFIRCTDPDKVTGSTAYEVNIWDRRPDPSYGTGAIVNVAKVSPMPKSAGKWNVYEIVAKGSTFTVTLGNRIRLDHKSEVFLRPSVDIDPSWVKTPQARKRGEWSFSELPRTTTHTRRRH